MAEIDLGNTNAVMQGAQTGLNWAQGQANLDIQRQHVQNQADQLEQMKKEFNTKIGDAYFNEMSDIATLPNGPVKKARMEALKNHAGQSGVTLDDSMISSLNDENFQVNWAKLKEGMTGVKTSDPDLYNQAMSQFTSVMGQKASLPLFEKAIQGADMLQIAAARNQTARDNNAATNAAGLQKAQISAGARYAQLEASNVKSGQQGYEKVIAPIRFALEGGSRAKDLINQAMDPNTPAEKKIALTSQIRTVLANEEARLVTGKANFGEGTAANMQVGGFYSSAHDFLNKLAPLFDKDGRPVDTIPPGMLEQMGNFYDDLTGAYMEAHDRAANAQLGGALPAQKKAILGRAKAFQKQYGKKFGQWKGPGLDTGEGTDEAQGAGIQGDNGQPAQPAAGASSPPAAPASSSQGQGPVGGANQNPPVDSVKMQQAAQIFQKYQGLLKTDPDKAQMFLQKMRQMFPQQIRDRLGIK